MAVPFSTPAPAERSSAPRSIDLSLELSAYRVAAFFKGAARGRASTDIRGGA